MKIVVITNGNYFARLILEGLFKERREQIEGVVLISGDYHGRPPLEALFKIGRKTAFRYIAYKVIWYLLCKLAAYLKPRALFDVRSLCRHAGISNVMESLSVNSEEVREFVSAHHPDLLISVSCPQLIKKPLLSIPTLASINIHSSLLPRYAGLAPYFWVLANGEEETGISVHFMTLKFDKGNIIAYRKRRIETTQSAFDLFGKLASDGSGALLDATTQLESGGKGQPQDPEEYSYYSNPTPAAIEKLHGNGHCIARLSEMISIIREEKSI